MYGQEMMEESTFRVRSQTTVMGIPATILPKLQTLKYNTGVPISWMAAVCERTGWNPNYKVNNEAYSPSDPHYVRQFGVAGIWAAVPEILQPTGGEWFQAQTALSGWSVFVAGTGWYCGQARPMDIDANLALAAAILRESKRLMEARCGGIGNLLFLYWQFGCLYKPEVDINGKCLSPVNLPPMFANEVDTLLHIQGLYAEQLGEDPLVPPLPGQCQAGQVWDPVQSQCVTETPPPPAGGGTSPVLWGLLGLLGLVGIFGLAKKRQNDRR